MDKAELFEGINVAEDRQDEILQTFEHCQTVAQHNAEHAERLLLRTLTDQSPVVQKALVGRLQND